MMVSEPQEQNIHSSSAHQLNSQGFTLIELLMAISLLAILSLIGISQYINFSDEARESVTLEKLSALKFAIVGDARMLAAGKSTNMGYEEHCLAPPTALADLVTQPGAGTCAAAYDPYLKRGWRGPYINSSDANWSNDAWGTALEYYVTGPPARTIRSCGPDETCGNADDLSVTF